MARDTATMNLARGTTRNTVWEIRGIDLSAEPTHAVQTDGVKFPAVKEGENLVATSLESLKALAEDVAYFSNGDRFNEDNWTPLVWVEGEGADKTVVVSNVVAPDDQAEMAHISQL